MNTLSTISLVNGLFSLFLAFVILAKAKENVHYVWSIFLLSLSLWSWGLLGFSSTNIASIAHIWWSISNIGIILIPVSLSHFVLEFLNMAKTRFMFLLFSYIITGLFLVLNLISDIFFKSLSISQDRYYFILPTPFYTFFILFFVILFFYNIAILTRAYGGKFEREKRQIKYILVALIIGLSGGLSSFSLLFGVNIYPIWNITLSLLALQITYTIVRYRLMDIKFVMRKYTVFIISMALIFFPAILIKYISNKYSINYGKSVDLTYLLSAILLFPYIKSKTSLFANKYFFSSLYESKKLIAEVSEKLRSTLKISEIYNFIYTSIDAAMHVKSFGILRYEEKKKLYTTQYNISFNIGRRVNFDENDVLQDFFEKEKRYLLVSDSKNLDKDPRTKDTLDIMHRMKVELLLPLSIKERIVGLIVLGEKESGDIYNEEDLQVLSIIASQSAMAIENATLYEGTKNFSNRMEDEVKRATSDLRVVNERLKKLDEAKSEFISIASHQLRTPLTIIKGYISMMLEGSFGNVSVVIKDSLNKVFDSNERLISLVDNLLNISRIESGHIKFNFKKIKLEKLVGDIVEELMAKAKVKSLDLVFINPDKKLAEIVVDVEKIRQVIMNLIDNSIKYTNHGKIIVSIEQKNNNLLFFVSDTGIGIKEQDIPNLFKKFSRGTGATLEHTEGTGLGLFVAKQMIDAHNGRIWIESEGEGKGAKLCFELPLQKKI